MIITPIELLERANMSLIFGIIFTIIGWVLLQFNKKPDVNEMKTKDIKQQLKTTFSLMNNIRSKGLFQIGI